MLYIGYCHTFDKITILVVNKGEIVELVLNKQRTRLERSIFSEVVRGSEGSRKGCNLLLEAAATFEN